MLLNSEIVLLFQSFSRLPLTCCHFVCPEVSPRSCLACHGHQPETRIAQNLHAPRKCSYPSNRVLTRNGDEIWVCNRKISSNPRSFPCLIMCFLSNAAHLAVAITCQTYADGAFSSHPSFPRICGISIHVFFSTI